MRYQKDDDVDWEFGWVSTAFEFVGSVALHGLTSMVGVIEFVGSSIISAVKESISQK
jgi:hypothetical protein